MTTMTLRTHLDGGHTNTTIDTNGDVPTTAEAAALVEKHFRAVDDSKGRLAHVAPPAASVA